MRILWLFASNLSHVSDHSQDDPVPFTNEPLEHVVTYNVTSLRPAEIFGHDWPLVYYSQSPSAGFIPESRQLERGTLVQVEK